MKLLLFPIAVAAIASTVVATDSTQSTGLPLVQSVRIPYFNRTPNLPKKITEPAPSRPPPFRAAC